MDCRTEGTGVTRHHDLDYLKTLDLGYGYTADNGKTFPLRGKGVGLLPELGEVFSAFPSQKFLINFKGRETREGEMLATLLDENPKWRQSVWGVYGGAESTWRATKRVGGNLHGFTRASVKNCLKRYIAFGWTSYVPESCRNTFVMVPMNRAPWLWGWPNLFSQRLQSVNSEIILIGNMDSNGAPGIDTLTQVSRIPETFSGYIWTNKVEVVGPAVQKLRSD